MHHLKLYKQNVKMIYNNKYWIINQNMNPYLVISYQDISLIHANKKKKI